MWKPPVTDEETPHPPDIKWNVKKGRKRRNEGLSLYLSTSSAPFEWGKNKETQ